MLKQELLDFSHKLNTNFIFPDNLLKIGVLAAFSQKLSKNFDFSILKQVNDYRWFFPKQVHSDIVIFLWEKDLVPEIFGIEGDAVLTNQKKLLVGVKTADCVPILLATQDAKIIGAVHAGWKGTVSKILEKTLKTVLTLGYRPEEIFLAIGPHIKACCYEVQKDVLLYLEKNFSFYEDVIRYNQEKFFLDLERLNVYQALSLGIPESNLWISQDCTKCLSGLYWSHRCHGKDRGVQISFIGNF
ncbi:peptidoglycan editing factor PgeF [Thermodesulfobacterium sp. TA1]|uniref:peptidoglycan editing factor PgeF n=1 Tax=Thermodesulfobacterium sp. TA1 TaxID=2234087 RepID=UPI001231E74B|nr:peptidoglycan editing factor PgeF [Thermodesulfobacterium sp. TA1]QER42139.1 peptidoglycan editing factor PgeF [Thermodesulfobacterium sp. TA1]